MKKRTLSVIIFIQAILLSFSAGIFSIGTNNPIETYATALSREADIISAEPPKDIGDLQSADDEQLNYWADNLESFDGRNFDIVTPTRQQGQRNICWAYAPVGAVESNILRKGIDESATKYNLDFDERVLAYARFNRDGLHDPLYLTADDAGSAGFWDSGDKGYNAYDTMTEGYALVEQNDSLDLDDLDAMNGELMQSKYYIQNYFMISKDTDSIKRAILKYGAVSFTYASPGSNAKYFSGSTVHKTNHESLIVGWDDTINRQDFTPSRPTGNGAWIVKNSWGNYGADQYNGIYCFYMSYEQYITAPYVVDVAMRENYQNIYHYDGQISSSRSSADAEKQAAIYEAKLSSPTQQEQLTAVTIYTDLSNINVKAEIRKNLSVNPGDVNDEANNPEQGPVVESKTAHIDISGFHTIDFDKPINLEQGEYFSIVISSSEANNKPVAVCTPDKTSVNDMTYYFLDGKWESYKKSDNYADTSYGSHVAKIRAITNVVDRGENLGKNLKYARIEIEDRLVFYEGKDLIPDIEVYFDEQLLKQNTDYEVKVENNILPGTATVTITGAGEFTGTRTTHFEVARAKYPPGRISGTVKVYDNIVKAHDFKIPNGWEWIGNDEQLKPGKSQFQFSLKYVGADANLYQNTVCSFYIEKTEENPPAQTDISEVNVEISGDYVYTGKSVEPRVRVTYQGKELTYDTDYLLTFQKNTDAGTATVTAIGNGNYKGQKSQDFKIRKARWPEGKPKSAMLVDDSIKNLNEISLDAGWAWQKNLDISSDKIQAVAIYNGPNKENYANTKTAVTITRESATGQKNISLISELRLEQIEYVYNGRDNEPNVIAKDGEKTLDSNADFEVQYINNRDAGQASVIVKGKNDYNGAITLYFTIKRADIENFNVILDGWIYGENPSTPRAESEADIADVTFLYANEENGQYTSDMPENAGTYWIKAMAAQSKNYNSAEAKAPFTIEKADNPDPMPSTEMTVERKIKTLQAVDLIDGWKWAEPDAKIDKETIKAYAIYKDTQNYKNYQVEIMITKQPRKEASLLSVNIEVGPFVYDGTEKTPQIIAKDGEVSLALGADFDVRYEDNKFAGRGKAIVTFINDYIGTRELDFTISKAEKPNVNTTIRYNKKAAKLSDISLPDGFVWEDENTEITGSRITAKAIYTGEDAGSYKTIELTFEIIIEEQPDSPGNPAQASLIWLAIAVPIAVLTVACTVFAIAAHRRKNQRKNK